MMADWVMDSGPSFLFSASIITALLSVVRFAAYLRLGEEVARLSESVVFAGAAAIFMVCAAAMTWLQRFWVFG